MNKFDVSVLKQYAGNYDENQMWNKIKGFFFEAGINLVIKVLQLWYVLQKPEVPVHVKAPSRHRLKALNKKSWFCLKTRRLA